MSNSMHDFLAMGGYGLYIWISYALTLLVLVVNLLTPILRKKEIMRSIQRSIKRREMNKANEIKEMKEVKE